MADQIGHDSSVRHNSPPNMLDATTGTDPDGERKIPWNDRPSIGKREKNKSTLLDLLGITKTMKLNQEHARVLENLKRYQALEKRLDDLNARLDKLIELLTVATGGGQKSLLIAAASKADTALDAFSTMLDAFPKSGELDDEQRKLLAVSLKNLKEKCTSFDNIWKATKNYSAEANDVIIRYNRKIKVVKKKFKPFKSS